MELHFTGMYQAYLKLMQKQLYKSFWWTGKQLEDNYKENITVISKNKTLRKTKMTKKGEGIPKTKEKKIRQIQKEPRLFLQMQQKFSVVLAVVGIDRLVGIEN